MLVVVPTASSILLVHSTVSVRYCRTEDDLLRFSCRGRSFRFVDQSHYRTATYCSLLRYALHSVSLFGRSMAGIRWSLLVAATGTKAFVLPLVQILSWIVMGCWFKKYVVVHSCILFYL